MKIYYLHEDIKINTYLTQLKPKIRREVKCKSPSSLREAQRIAMIYDDQYDRDINWNRNYFKKPNFKQNIQTDDMEIDNISSRSKSIRQPKVCYNCQKEGHFATNCPNKSKKLRQSNKQVGFDVLKDLKKLAVKSKRNNIVDVSVIKSENKVNTNTLEEYESKSVYEEVVDDKKYITKIKGNLERSRNSLENSYDVNFVGSENLDKEPTERSVIGKGKSKLQETLFIIPVKIRNKESRALIGSGAQSNFITPELVEELKLETEIAPEVVLTTVTGETSKANRKVLFELKIGNELVEVQCYVATYKHPIILGRPFTKTHEKDIVNDTVFGVKNRERRVELCRF